MLWPLLLLCSFAFAQDELDLEAIIELGTELPSTEKFDSKDYDQRKYSSRHRYPFKKTSFESILTSGMEHGHVEAGRNLIRIKDNTPVKIPVEFYGKFYRLQDDLGYKYLLGNDGSCKYKIKAELFNSIEQELALYVPPLKYTPAPTNIIRSDYDKKLKILPEATLLVGVVNGSYMRDLFNDDKAASGTTQQYGMHFATDWKLPLKAGLVIHYEKSSYKLSGGGQVLYSAASLGPQFKSKDLDVWGEAMRFQAQFRVSPFARANAETTQGNVSFKFNSADLLLSVEHPIKNKLGEFVLGFFFQSQWLNLKQQPEIVSINATNEINKSFGLSFAQVFE
jgi:hypothetical protein